MIDGVDIHGGFLLRREVAEDCRVRMYGEGLVVEEVCRPPDESQGVKEVIACLPA